MKRFSQDFLARVSRGRPGRAALVLVAAHLGVVVLAAGAWAIGLAPIFDHTRWVRIVLVSVVAAVTVLPMYLLFGFTGTLANHGVGSGEDYGEAFGPAAGMALLLLRWVMQLVMVAGVLAALAFTVVDARWWNLAGTDEIRELPARVAAMPVPDDWTLVDSEHGDDGGEKSPNMRYWLTYEMPAGSTFEDVEAWVTGPAWTTGPAAFGALRTEYCDPVPDRQTCDAHVVPPDGQEPEYFLHVDFDEPWAEGEPPEVDVQLRYQRYEAPRWEVDDVVVARANAIPVPADWVRFDARDEKTPHEQRFSQRFGVPQTFTEDDLEAWITGPAWTAPEAGEPFGAVTLYDECRLVIADAFSCDASVDASVTTDAMGFDRATDWVEATFGESDHTVSVTFRRVR